ncbi:MAG: Ig-like domain-containing protein, partial [Pseudomonadota bacterium]
MSNVENVLVTDKETGQVSEVDLSALENPTNSVITLKVAPEDIASVEARSGDLVLTLKSGESVVIEGFFDPEEAQRNELVLEDSDGILWWGQYDSPWSEFWFAEINADKAATDEEGSPWWLVAAGLGGAALVAAAAGGGGSSSSGSSPGTEPTAPDAPVVDSVINDFDEQGEPTGTTVSGETDPGNTIEIRDDGGNVVGSGTADSEGNFDVTTDEPLADGEEYDVVAIDEDGNESEPTPVTGDLTPPAVDVDPTDGTEVSGTAEPGSTVEVDVDGDGTPDHTTEADADGNWSVTPDTPLDDGTEVSVTATDDAGNTSDPVTVTVDAAAPAAPTIVTATDDVGDVTGDLSSGDSTDDTTPTLNGTAEAESTVTVFQDGVEIGTVEADATGDWSLEVPTLAEGDHSFTATATDAAGNESPASTAFDLTVDTVAPTVDVDPQTTNDTTPELTGTVDDPDADITVTVDGTDYAATNNGDGTWTLADDTLPAL